jgi:NAD(P)-dependent dehydrogenase (short-subunit alcohol dehydrogenase family)
MRAEAKLTATLQGATANALQYARSRVFGTSRRTVAKGSAGVTMLSCDVTDEASVATLVDEVLAETGRIGALPLTVRLFYWWQLTPNALSFSRREEAPRPYDPHLRAVAFVVGGALFSSARVVVRVIETQRRRAPGRRRAGKLGVR